MQLSLFDTNEYRSIAIGREDVTWKPSKMKFPYLIGIADVFYHKDKPLFQLQMQNDSLSFWSISGKSCTNYKTDDIERTLNRNIDLYIEMRCKNEHNSND